MLYLNTDVRNIHAPAAGALKRAVHRVKMHWSTNICHSWVILHCLRRTVQMSCILSKNIYMILWSCNLAPGSWTGEEVLTCCSMSSCCWHNRLSEWPGRRSLVLSVCSRHYGFSYIIVLRPCARITHELKVITLHGADTDTKNRVRKRGREGGSGKMFCLIFPVWSTLVLIFSLYSYCWFPACTRCHLTYRFSICILS